MIVLKIYFRIDYELDLLIKLTSIIVITFCKIHKIIFIQIHSFFCNFHLSLFFTLLGYNLCYNCHYSWIISKNKLRIQFSFRVDIQLKPFWKTYTMYTLIPSIIGGLAISKINCARSLNSFFINQISQHTLECPF